ncbi:SigE family RNA polymerase sigma factor [Nocardioides sp. AE5]|uniref:SigE family RNA polymerase sigma factor n=1 Tax=Nocardioides sp. AE5 TaxID=2962573 RepID=UPI002881E49D|nr:SigE family RNA polymerase sigma factor [Nocardioides sp. AE5]MDT0202050.1 SigE family RNA polymerase sigma factor [Nocardioides sp. AE5]
MVQTGRTASKDAEFSAWMAARQPALLRTAYLLTGEHHGAEDLLQVTLAKVYLTWQKVREREAIDGYARRIMVNENNSLWRRAWKRREHSSSEVPEWVPVHDTYDEGRSGQLWELVKTLPPKQRAAVVLRYYEELSEAETADVLGCSVGTVKSQTSRALATLRSTAGDHGINRQDHLGEEER